MTAVATQASPAIRTQIPARKTSSTQLPRLAPPTGAEAGTASLDRLGSLHVMPRGKTIVEQGDAAEHVYKVVSGALRMVRLLPDGRRSVIDFLLPGDFFGLAEDGTYSHSLEVLSDTSFVRYPKQQLKQLLEEDPRAGRRFFNLMCGQLSAAQERLLTLCRKSAVERIASFLLAMTERTRSPKTVDADTIKLPMCRADIADYLGLTIETVSRILTQLRESHVIDIPTASQIVVRDRGKLVTIGSGVA